MAGGSSRRDPRGHWILLFLGGFILAAGLLLQGYAHGAVGESSQHDYSGGGAAPAAVTHGGPVLNLSGGRPQSVRMPRHTIALTFDDGPDPRWTPQILDVLRRHQAHATFFVVGAHTADHPGLVRRALREGNEIGSHTYTHIDMASSSAWRIGLELGLTQRALAGAAGIHTRLLRMPYSSLTADMSAPEYRAAQESARLGYVLVSTDRDTEDWRRPGVAHIVRAATPPNGAGAVVMMHDAGGDRAQTVRALDTLLTSLSAKGYHFTTLSAATHLPAADVSASTTAKVTGTALVDGQRAAGWLAGAFAALFAVAAVLTGLRLLALPIFARMHVRRTRRERRRRARPWLAAGMTPPPVSVIVPAYNEQVGLAATVRSLVRTDYPAPIEVIIVDDGSTDDTPFIGHQLAQEFPHVELVRRPNGGKPAALNTGIARARYEILVLVDGDTVFQPDTIGKLVGQLADPAVGAVSGNTKVANRKGLIGRWQHIEYVIGFNLDRRMFDVLECMPTVPGAIGAFRRRALAAAGGLSTDTLAEDTDLTMAICRAGWRVVYEETAIAWTEAPSSLRQLWRQRYRWCYGTLQSMWKHKRSLVERGRSGRFGRRCLPYLMIFQVLLPVFAPVVDIFAGYGLIFLNPLTVTASWLAFAGAQALASMYALRLDGERLRTLWVLPLQQVVYRQLMYLVVIQSLVTAILGARLRWHVIRRTGTFSEGDPLPSQANA
ncbi:MAG: polysaccharide deacetylase [Actinoallomurus sp.]|jgi:cellulose synthase/poly-beta-1,6-N-acetylglucosamine synthase-like glycosyltransferase/peptidoglycan/xylan/chitin deacetylase (PgdA/CDA1 family)|nr:polysaccharide deacetylase [Actinoallomurus sp.]